MFRGKKVIGVVAEFNPFHEGHRYLLRTAKEECGAAYVIAVMSGDFVQRGEPAFFSKFERAEKAVLGGVDLLLQMPLCFSVSSAEDFARSGVSMLSDCGIVDELVFGSESGRRERLEELASFLLREDREGTAFSARLRDGLRKGQSFPRAREKALSEFLPGLPLTLSPNDLLGLEYLKALKSLGNPFPFRLIPRNMRLRSAHSIREDIMESCGRDCGHRCYAELDMLSEMLSYRLLLLRHSGIPLTEFQDVSGELSARILERAGERLRFRERIERAKGKNLTWSRISRALLHILLDIRSEEYQRERERGYAPFLRVLSVSEEGREMLGALKRPPLVPLGRALRRDASLGESFSMRTDLLGAAIYRQIYPDAPEELRQKLLLVRR